MPTIPQKELRNNVADVLRRAEAGEEFTITVAGRPVAQLGPPQRRRWVSGPDLARVWETPGAGDARRRPRAVPRRARRPVRVVRAVLDTSVLIGAESPGELEGAISAASLAELHFGVLVARDR